jgi:hypothetical protein
MRLFFPTLKWQGIALFRTMRWFTVLTVIFIAVFAVLANMGLDDSNFLFWLYSIVWMLGYGYVIAPILVFEMHYGKLFCIQHLINRPHYVVLLADMLLRSILVIPGVAVIYLATVLYSVSDVPPFWYGVFFGDTFFPNVPLAVPLFLIYMFIILLPAADLFIDGLTSINSKYSFLLGVPMVFMQVAVLFLVIGLSNIEPIQNFFARDITFTPATAIAIFFLLAVPALLFWLGSWLVDNKVSMGDL